MAFKGPRPSADHWAGHAAEASTVACGWEGCNDELHGGVSARGGVLCNGLLYVTSLAAATAAPLSVLFDWSLRDAARADVAAASSPCSTKRNMLASESHHIQNASCISNFKGSHATQSHTPSHPQLFRDQKTHCVKAGWEDHNTTVERDPTRR